MTGHHAGSPAEGSPEYWRAMHDRLSGPSPRPVAVLARRDPLGPAQRRAISISRELHTLNEVRAARMRVMAVAHELRGPADFASYLMETARIDRRRRLLRGLLADQMEAITR